MATGWIRAYEEEDESVGTDVTYFRRPQRAEFRASFATQLHENRSANSSVLKRLKWGDTVELPSGLATGTWTRVEVKTLVGFVKTSHLIEVAYVTKKTKRNGSMTVVFKMDYQRYDALSQTFKDKKKKLIWGDLVQIIKRTDDGCHVRVRGVYGVMSDSDLTDTALLDVYFIDVGQGDGVYLCTPDFRHMLIDGGLERRKQQTGKNAADFVDWKFFVDYGDYKIRLNSMMASHSDSDHYGGLHDLLRTTELALRELDCLSVDVDTFHHPGLSRWRKVKNATPAHSKGLGPRQDGAFVRLLNDRADAEKSTDGSATEQLAGPWRRFVKAVVENSKRTKVKPVTLAKNDLESGAALPQLWPAAHNCSIKILAPVSLEVNGKAALPDLGVKSINTNGHSICLRVDYNDARILLTGDLNTASMHWLEQCYGDRIGTFKCDVAKACHHGSHDISYRFLKEMEPSATIISSGDAEGYAHPRPEVVAASAITGYRTIDTENDKLLTPLIYMSEIERSVTLGSINRIDIRNLDSDKGRCKGVIPGRPVDEIDNMGFVPRAQRKEFKDILESTKRTKLAKSIRKIEEPVLQAQQSKTQRGYTRADFNLSIPLGPVNKQNVSLRSWRARVMQKTHYGLVSVRTDGTDIMCATLDEVGDDWITHVFKARFGNRN